MSTAEHTSQSSGVGHCHGDNITIIYLMCCHVICDVCDGGVSVEVAEACVIPELVELLCDEESQVRVAALEVVVELISFWSEPCLSTIIKPLILKFCNSVMKTDDLVILEGVAQLLGKLCHELKGNFVCVYVNTMTGHKTRL